MGARENTCHLEGNLATEPELRFTNTGIAVTTLVVAHSDRRIIDGQWQDGPVSYFDCVVFGPQAEHAINSFRKGSRVSIDGSMRQRHWADATSGEKRYKHEIVADLVSAPLRFAPVLAGEKAEMAEKAEATTAVVGRSFEGKPKEQALEVEPF